MVEEKLLKKLHDHDRHVHNNECFYERQALIAVLEMHKATSEFVDGVWIYTCPDSQLYACPTIQAIEEVLK